MEVLVIDVGGTHVKVGAPNQTEVRKVNSGPNMTAPSMVDAVKRVTEGWSYDAVSIGYPGPVVHNSPIKEPANLGPGWVGFDFATAFGRPVKVVNDAAMQALGSYRGGRMLFLGLGTGLGSAVIVDGVVQPLELAHLPYRNTRTYEDVVGLRGLIRLGKKKWRREVTAVVEELTAALLPEYVVIGGGNAKLLKELPPNTYLGDNSSAIPGGFRLWQDEPSAPLARDQERDLVLDAVPQRTLAERHVLDDETSLLQAAAAEFVACAHTAVASSGRFVVALSGGSTPRGLYTLLTTDTWREQVPWQQTHVFWGDERHVPPDHPDSNFGVADELLLSVVPVPAENVHRVHGELGDAAEAASSYEADLVAFFGHSAGLLPRFDLVMLGLGSDGHTASLFPGTRALADTSRLVVSNWVGKFFAWRVTLTLPVLNNTAYVLFLVSGDDKAPALKAVLEGPYEPEQLPAQLIQPTHGRLVWLVDQAAAQSLAADAA